MKIRILCMYVVLTLLVGMLLPSQGNTPGDMEPESSRVGVLHVSTCVKDEVQSVMDKAGATALFDITQVSIFDFNAGQPIDLSHYDVVTFSLNDCYECHYTVIQRVSELRQYVENGGGIVWTHDTLEHDTDLGLEAEEPAGVNYKPPGGYDPFNEVQIVLDHQMMHEPFEIGNVGDVFSIQETHTTGGEVTTADVILNSPHLGEDAKNFYLTAHDWLEGRVAVDELGHKVYDCFCNFQSWPSVLESKIYANALWWAGKGVSPVADAGPDQTVNEGELVQFDGTGSSIGPICVGTIQEMEAKLPTPRYGATAVWNGRHIFVFGGRDASGKHALTDVLRFDPNKDEIVTMGAQLPNMTRDAASVWDGKNAFVFAGYYEGQYLPTIVRYNISNDQTYQSKEQFDTGQGLQSPASVWDGNYSYIFGGKFNQGFDTTSDLIFRYNHGKDELVRMSGRLTQGRYDISAIWDGEYAYVFGGVNQTLLEPFNEVLRYHPVTDNLTKLYATMPSGRARTASAWLDTGDICSGAYVIGGSGASGFLDQILRFDTKKEISELTDHKLPIPLAAMAAVGRGHDIFIFGGESTNSLSDKIYKLSLSASSRQNLTFEWDFNNHIDTDGDGNYTDDVEGTGPTPSHIYGDNGNYTVTLKVTCEQGLPDIDTMVVTVLNVPPSLIDSPPPNITVYEGSPLILQAVAMDDGSDDLTFTWHWDYGPAETRTFYNDGTSPDPPNSPGGIFPFNASDSSTHIYGDDCNCTVTLTVVDDDGGAIKHTTVVNVANMPPAIVGDVRAYAMGDLTLRIAGEKWHDVMLRLLEDGAEVGNVSIVRYPGSPDDQSVTMENVTIDILHGVLSAVVEYTPLDDPVNGQVWGATPAWLIFTPHNGGEESRIHHTFNARHPDTWVWTIGNFNAFLVGASITFEATVADPGSDDITFSWDWGDGLSSLTTYFNNVSGPDPYPSPDVKPMLVTDIHTHAYSVAGTYTIRLIVEDDDGGAMIHSFDLTL